MQVPIHFSWNKTLDVYGFSTTMGMQTTFGDAIRSACSELNWQVSDWDFFFGPIELGLDARVDLDRTLTPTMCDFDAADEVTILCVRARASV
jgi:hypothetical protein